MYGKIIINCKMKLLTGMHIGGTNIFSAIGAVDSPVIRDGYTGEPMVPGSSLKGKMRTLLAKSIKNHYITQPWGEDPEEIKRLFGTAGGRNEKVKAARLQFADAFLINEKELKERGGMTEVKFENNINRLTSVAMPRQIERVSRGAEFAVNMVYDIESDEIKEDFINIAKGLKLLSMDYLGGHGSRGYGRVAFKGFQVQVKSDKCPQSEKELLDILKEVEEYELFAI